MTTWSLIVETPTKDHEVPVGQDDGQAFAALEEAKRFIGKDETVTIANRLVLDARTIISVLIREDSG